MTEKINLSYVLTTRNKMPYLKEVLARLINECKVDEEIVIVDGGSTDGTIEYLQRLKDAKQIQQFITGPDSGEAHGTNKALLMAKGELIKILTDDDAFYWPGIQKCKEFMLAHPEIDILGSNGAGTTLENAKITYSEDGYSSLYQRWCQDFTPFDFCGLGIMLRRSSIPLIGLFDPSFTRADYEFSLRITSGRANLAWFSGFNFIRITNYKSTSVTNYYSITQDTNWLDMIYFGKLPSNKSNHFTYWRKLLVRLMTGIKRMRCQEIANKKINIPNENDQNINFPVLYALCDKWLLDQNQSTIGKFLISKREKSFPKQLQQCHGDIIRKLQNRR